MIGTEFSSRYSMIGAISDALISRIPDRISETAPGRTPIAAARPPLVLPGFCSPRSINLTSSMAHPFPNSGNNSSSDYPKSGLTLVSEYKKLWEASGVAEKRRNETMEMTNWAPGHSDALRGYLAQGMSFSQIARAINAKFNTAYSRNATIGRARRLGLMGPDRPSSSLAAQAQLDRLGGLRPSAPKSTVCHWSAAGFERAKPGELR